MKTTSTCKKQIHYGKLLTALLLGLSFSPITFALPGDGQRNNNPVNQNGNQTQNQQANRRDNTTRPNPGTAPNPETNPGPEINPNPGPAPNPELVNLGREIFFDANLSNPSGQSCASCHTPEAGFADPNNLATSQGAVSGVFGSRNAPTISYAAFIPRFQTNNNRRGGGVRGGLFWDGRVNTLKEQAKAPFLSALEMNNDSEEAVIEKIRGASYADQFTAIFGAETLADTGIAFDRVAEALADFERSEEVSPFNARFDAVMQGDTDFTEAELRGAELFTGRANCAQCHRNGNNAGQVFSNFSYENTGVPANSNNPFLTNPSELNPAGNSFIDLGLGGVTGLPRENGRFRTPTLRNISLTAPYMHNGVFNTLHEVLEFYNTREVNSVATIPEVSANVTQRGRIGNLNLSEADIDDIIAFLNTLTDEKE